MAQPVTLLRQPESVTLELAGPDGAPQARPVRVRALRRDARGPVLEAVCAETGQPQSFAAARVRALRHGDGRAESTEAFVERVAAEVEGAAPDARWMWIDRLVMAGIALVVAVAVLAIQGPKDLGLYANFWSFALFLAGGLLAWTLLKQFLGLPRRARPSPRP